ncbi:MAG: DUF1585 domain-containing protein [Myxococcota bacterium]
MHLLAERRLPRRSFTCVLLSAWIASGCTATTQQPEPSEPSPDASVNHPDASQPITDAGIPDRDASTPDLDASTPELDASTPGTDAAAQRLDAAVDVDATVEVDAGQEPDAGYQGPTPCDVVDQLLAPKCARCHPGTGQVDFSTAMALNALVGRESEQYPGELFVVPGNPESSLLYRKIGGNIDGLGDPMPLGGSTTTEERDVVYQWIALGALPVTCESAQPDAGVPGDAGVPEGDAGQGDGGEPGVDGGTGLPPSVCDVVERVLGPRCTGCHDGAYQRDFREGAARTALVSQESTLYPGNFLVVPGDPANSLLYRKVTGDLAGVGASMPPGSTLNAGELSVIREWILGGASVDCGAVPVTELVPLSPEAHLNRVAMALTGTRPTAAELAAVRADPNAVDDIMDAYMRRPQFGETIQELHNDALLLKTTMLFQLLFPAIEELKDLKNLDARYNDMSFVTRSILEAPLRTAEFIVVTDRPYTEVVTGNYVVSNPAHQAVYGDGSVQDHLFYGIAETSAVGSAYQYSEDPYGLGADGDFDVHRWMDGRGAAGIISDNSFFHRWMSAGVNYNRGRANQVTKAFLCYDFLSQPVDLTSEGGLDLSDPDAVANAVKDPSTSCWGCHATLDPIASYMQEWRPLYIPSIAGSDGYPFPMRSQLFAEYFANLATGGSWMNSRPPGYFAATTEEPNPPPVDYDFNGRIDIGDLGAQIADDPRFATCTVKRFYSFFTQTSLNDVPAAVVDELVPVFTGNNFSAKTLIKAIMMSERFRASHTATAVGADEINGILRARPSQLARVYQAATGVTLAFPLSDFILTLTTRPDEEGLPYGMTDYMRDSFIGFRELAGDTDSFIVTRPVTTFTAGTHSANRWLGNFGGYYAVILEASVPLASRRLFTTAEMFDPSETAVRTLLVELHLKLFGQEVTADSPEVDEAYALWTSLYALSGDIGRTWHHVLSAFLQDARTFTY